MENYTFDRCTSIIVEEGKMMLKTALLITYAAAGDGRRLLQSSRYNRLFIFHSFTVLIAKSPRAIISRLTSATPEKLARHLSNVWRSSRKGSILLAQHGILGTSVSTSINYLYIEGYLSYVV